MSLRRDAVAAVLRASCSEALRANGLGELGELGLRLLPHLGGRLGAGDHVAEVLGQVRVGDGQGLHGAHGGGQGLVGLHQGRGSRGGGDRDRKSVV